MPKSIGGGITKKKTPPPANPNIFADPIATLPVKPEPKPTVVGTKHSPKRNRVRVDRSPSGAVDSLVPELRPASKKPPVTREQPAYPGEKPAGYVAVPVSKQHPTGMKPLYRGTPGPEADPKTQMNPVEQASAARYRQKELGTPGTILRDSLESPALKALSEGAVHPAGLALEAGSMVTLGPLGRGLNVARKGLLEADRLKDTLRALSEDKTGRWHVETLQNGYVHVHDRQSGLVGLFDPQNGEKRSGDLRLPSLESHTTSGRRKDFLKDRLKDESGSAQPGAFLPDHSGPYDPRTIKVNDLEQQLPKARSRITQPVERAVDRASVALQKSEHVRDLPGVRIVTAGERAVKAAGRSQRAERARAEAGVFEHLHAIGKIKEGSAEDIANFWYAQLPRAYRNPMALRAIRAKQTQEMEYISSGKALEDLSRHEAAVKAAMRDAGSDSERLALLRDVEEIKVLKTDLPQRVEDIGASIAQLDELVAKPPAVNEAAIHAADVLSRDRERVLVGGNRLKQDRADERRGLVSRFVGLEPTGEEAFVGHRLPRPESFRGSFMPSGGTGRVASPAGVGSKNNLVLAKNGRLRASLRVAAEDWYSSQVFEQANVARDHLAKIGAKFDGHVPEGHVLVNPKGRTIPAHWKSDELSQFTEGYDDIPALRAKAQEILDGFVATDRAGFEEMKRQALEQGVSWDELRVVPKRLLDRYYAQFRATKGRVKGLDSAIDAVATSIVFARLGYIPKNLVQNVIMAVPHQGALLLPNAVKAAQAMADPQLRHLLQAEVGHTGATGALGTEMASRKVMGKVAGFVGKIADDPARMSAFMHEAAAEGVISRVNPLLTEKDRKALLRLLTDESQRPLLNDIRSRSVEAMADFSRMTPDQSRMARRFLIIPGWLMAGSRYPFHFAATHPIRSALLAYIALGEPGAPERLQFNQPVSHYFTGSSYRRGIETPYGRVRTGSLSPVSTPWEFATAGVQTLRGKDGPFDFEHDTAFDYAQPLVAAGVRIAQGEGVKKNLEGLAPDVKFVRGMVNPAESDAYPEDKTRLGRLKREIGVVPIDVNDPEPKKKSLTPQGRADEWITHTEKVFGITLPDEFRKSAYAKAHYQEMQTALKDKLDVTKLTEKQRAALKVATLLESHPEYLKASEQIKALVRDASPAEMPRVDAWLETKLGWTDLDRLSAKVNKVERTRASAKP